MTKLGFEIEKKNVNWNWNLSGSGGGNWEWIGEKRSRARFRDLKLSFLRDCGSTGSSNAAMVDVSAMFEKKPWWRIAGKAAISRRKQKVNLIGRFNFYL